jgi:DNA-binding beta-propeller fold protein YncE
MTIVGSGFAERTDPNALVIGPTGLALNHSDRQDNDRNDTDRHDNDSHGGGVLYVADTLNNRIIAIEDPLQRNTSDGTGMTVFQGGALNAPLGLEIATNGNILTVNGGDGYLVETKVEGHHGHQVRKVLLDDTGAMGAGALFGLIDVAGQGIYFVDDNENALNLFH